MEVVYDKVMRRLVNVEKLLGIIDEKPKMVEDLENNLNILRTELFLKVAECENHVGGRCWVCCPVSVYRDCLGGDYRVFCF